MTVFMINLVLALLWTALAGSAEVAHLVVGFVVGYLVLWAVRPLLGETRYFQKLPLLVRFAGFFVVELVSSNIRVAWDVVTPRARRRPAVVAVPLDATTDTEITVLANLITLTPGTVTLDVSQDRRTLFVHAMFVHDADALRDGLKQGFERRVLELLR